MEFYKTTIRLDKETYNQLNAISKKTNESLAEVIRQVIKKGLANEWVDENKDVVAHIVREQMEVVLKPHVERLAKLSAKTGIMATTSTFLNVQAFQDLVPAERRKEPRDMYDKARKKAIEYMRTKEEDLKEKGEI